MSRGCEFYTDALVELARGELDPGRVDRVERHLAECAACRGDLEAIHAVRSAPAPVPEGLEARIRTAVHRQVTTGSEPAADPAPPSRRERPGARRFGSWGGWRAWALPVAAAAGLAIWLGGNALETEPAVAPTGVETAEYDPYGAWPASDGVVAGDLVLSELSVEELEALLEEMR